MKATMQRVCAVVLTVLASSLPAWGQPAERPAREASDSMQRLEALLKLAPSRHLSQPGNAAVDQWVQQRFESAAARRNGESRNAEAKRQIAAIASANDALSAARLAMDTAPEGEEATAAAAALDAAARDAWRVDQEAAGALKGLWQTGRVTYPTAVYHPGEAWLTAGGKKVRLYQIAPNMVDPGNMPEGGVDGPLVYIRGAWPADMAGVDLTDAVVLMDFDSSRRWIDAVQLGAKVIIVLEPAGHAANAVEASHKTTPSPIRVPRFYLKQSDLLALLGEQWQAVTKDRTTVQVDQTPGVWTREIVAADWLFIPGSNDAYATELVHVLASKDSNSVTPELSPGATGAANLVLVDQLIEDYERTTPSRPVLIGVVNAHTNGLQGESELAAAVFHDPDALLAELKEVDRELAIRHFIAKSYREPVTAELIERFRDGTARVAGQSVKLKQPALDMLREKNNQLRTARELTLNLHRQKRSSDPQAQREVDERVRAIDARMSEIEPFMQLFNRFGRVKRFGDLNEQQVARLGEYFLNIAAAADQQRNQLDEHRRQVVANLGVRRQLRWLAGGEDKLEPATATADEIFLHRHPPLTSAMLLGLDLTFDTGAVGLFPVGHLMGNSQQVNAHAVQRVSRMAVYTLTIADEYATQTGQPNLLVDTVRNVGGVSWDAHMGSRVGLITRPGHLLDRMGMTLTGVRDSRARCYTPHDTIDRLDRDRFEKIMTFARGFIPRLVDGADLSNNKRNVGKSDPLSVEVDVRVQDQYSVALPQTPLKDALVQVMTRNEGYGTVHMLTDVTPYVMHMTDSRGVIVSRGAIWRDGVFHAWKFDKDYRQLTDTLDLGMENRFASTLSALKATDRFQSRIIVAFEARKVDVIGLTEPVNLLPATVVQVLESYQNSAPRHYNVSGVQSRLHVKHCIKASDGTASIMVPPGRSFKLLSGRSLVINSEPENPDGVGYSPDAGMLPDLVSMGATDMWRLTRQRLGDLALKGVVNETASSFNDSAEEQLDLAAAARKEHRGDQALVHAEKARGLAYWAYVRTTGTVNDLIKAAIIFLALVIPFCFFMMKLITPFTDINRQLAMFAAIFVLMAILLWFVHPAFKIASNPSVVILAFVILGLAVFVSTVLMSRFNAAMARAIEQSQQSESIEAPQSRLMGVAFMVGVNNMKRRRIRTTLTCATIVLVTFTMLSVISVGQDVEPARVRISDAATYNGMLYSRPSLGTMTAIQARRLRAHYEGRATVVTRAWSQKLGEYGDYLDYHIDRVDGGNDRPLLAKVLVGLEPAEDGFLAPMPLLPGGRWFSSTEAREIVLSRSAAALLNVTQENFKGVHLEVRGRTLELIGLVDDDKLETMKDLGDLPLLPLLREASQSTKDRTAETNAAAAALEAETAGSSDLESGGDLLNQPGVRVARPTDVVFVPIEFALSLGEADYRTMSVKFDAASGAATAWREANDLIRFQFARVFVGLTSSVSLEEGAKSIESGQYALASSSSTQVAGVLKVAIPIILAATIIFNTMLGAVMERKREVSIYNAIGLNPGHVMTFFLAESLVFGMVGSVAGYLIGQILSLLITHFELLELNLNYSSMSVMLVIALTILTVLLSTVYPAMMAARAAVPSGQRRWSLPQPVGDEIHIQFPFSYDADRVLGVCAYLHDYMQQHSEASTGSFLSQTEAIGRTAAKEEGQDRAYVMVFDVAPAPFDLGVNQTMEIYAFYNHRVRAHMLSVHLTRVSGEKSNWMAVNQPFLESLRKRLLGWRSQKAETHEVFYRLGEKLFASAVDLPVREEK